MATETAVARVELDGQQASSELKELQQQATRLKKELKELKIARDPNYQAKKREYDELDKSITQLRKSTFDLNNVIKNVSGASVKDLTRAQRQLNAELRNVNRSTVEGNAVFKQKSAALQSVQAELKKVNNELRGVNQQQSFMQKASGAFSKYFGMFAAFGAAFAGIIMGFRKLIDNFNEYQTEVAGLSSLTGLAGEELEWLANQSKMLSTATLEGGVVIKQSAKDIVAAYSLIGSKMPILLQNKEALNEMTKAAIVLAESGRISLETAATSMAAAINQFGLDVSRSTDLINMFAAASQSGAGDIAFIGDALTNFGAAAKSTNVSIEESVIAIELLAKGGLEAGVAGTGMKTFLLASAKAADEFNIEVVGLYQALKNMNDAQLTTVDLQNMFGSRGFMVAAVLKDNIEEYKHLENVIKGTNKAFEMASVNTDTNAARLEQARNRAALLRMELGEKLAPALTFSTNSFSYLVKGIIALNNNWDKYLKLMLLTISIVGIYHAAKLRLLIIKALENTVMLKSNILLRAKNILTMAHLATTQLLAAAYMVLTGNIVGASQAMRVFMTILRTNPIGIALALITGIALAYEFYGKNAKEAKRLEELKSNALNRSNEIYADLTKSVNNYNSAIQSSVYWNNKDMIALQNSIKQDMLAAQAKLQLVRAKQFEIEQENRRLSLWKVGMTAAKALFSSSAEQIKASQGLFAEAWEQGTDAGKDFDEVINNMIKSIDELEKQMLGIDRVVNAESLAFAIQGKTIGELEEKVNLYRIALKNTELDSNDFHRIKNLLVITQKELNDAMEYGGDILDNTSNAYDALTKAINDSKKALAGFVAEGNFDAAKSMDASIKNLEAQKLVLDGIIASGGDVLQFLDDLTNADAALLEETANFNANALKDFMPIFEEINEAKKTANDEELERIKNRIEFELREEERKKNEKIQLEKDWAQAKQQITDAALSSAFQIAANYINSDYERQTNALNKRRDAELSNENLTAEQREVIHERYRKQEAAIKTQAWKRQHRADIIQSLINTALSVSRALQAPPGWPLNAPFVISAGIIGALQTAVIGTQKVPQFAKGRYNVTGATDGRGYNVPFEGTARTGIYRTPALVAERGDELIVDNPTLRRVRLNFPEALRAIDASRVPQYAGGRYPEMAGGAAVSTERLEQSISELRIGIAELRRAIPPNGVFEVEAHLNYQKIKKMDKDVDSIESSTRI